MKLKRELNYFAAMFFLAFFTAGLCADIPRQINYQGNLLDNNGTPVNGSIGMIFKFYTADTNGTLLFTEDRGTYDKVPVSNGIYNVLIGSVTSGGIPASVFTSTDSLWLDVTVAGNVLSPREKITAVGYAYQSEKLGGHGYDYFVDTATTQNIAGTKTFSGNVGIGTSSPAERLHTYKTGNYTNKLLVEQGTDYGAEIKLKDTVKEWSISEDVYVGGALCIRNISDSDTLMTLTATSKVGIGTTNPGRKLFVSGDAGGTTQWYNDSDIELKSNVKTIDNALNKIVKLRGVNFEWKDKENRPKGLQIGLVAQEVKDIIPEVVEKKGEYYSLATANLVALLIEAVKEQQEQIKGLKEEINLIVNKK